MTSTRGPVPKRSSQRRRTNHDTPIEKVRNVSTGVPEPADPAWQVSVQELWTALGDSPMSQYYTPADWAFAAKRILSSRTISLSLAWMMSGGRPAKFA